DCRARVALAFHASARLRRSASLMEAFRRLLRYTRSHTGLIVGAVLAMIVYGAASAAIAWLIKPIVDDVLPSQDRLGFVTTTPPVPSLPTGVRAHLFPPFLDA